MLGNRWPHKPPHGYEIDLEHPLAQGLVAVWIFNEGTGTPTELLGCNPTSASNAFSWGPNGAGLIGVFNGSSTDLTYSAVPAVGPAMSVCAGVMMTAISGNQFFVERSNVNATWGLFYYNSNVNWRGGNSTTRNKFSGSLLTAGLPFNVAVTDTGVGTGASNGSTMYLNGNAQAAGGASGNALPVANTNAIHLGNYDGSGYFLGGQINYIYLYNYALPASNVAAIAANPWQIFEPRRIQTYIGPLAVMTSPAGIKRIVAETTPPEPGNVIAVLRSTPAPVVATTIVLTASEAPQPYSGMSLAEGGQRAAIPQFNNPPVVASAWAESPGIESGGGLARCTRTQAGAVSTPPGRMTTAEAPAPYPGSVLSTAERPLAVPSFNPHAMAVIVAAEPQPSYPGSVLDSRKSELLIGSGYHVYSNTGSGDPINYTTLVATTLTSDTTWTSTALAAPGAWKFGVRAFNFYGEEQNLDCSVTIVLDAFGNDITNQPLPPIGLRAFATPRGSIRVEWYYPLTRGPTVPIGFNVYLGTGGTPSYATPAATVLYSAGLFNVFVANIAGLSDGTTYSVGVRAYNGSGAEQNTIAVSVTADAIGPAAVDSLLATAIV